MSDEQTEQLEEGAEYARVELMGHRQRVGEIQEVERFGVKLLRVKFLGEQGEPCQEEYSGNAIYCLTSLPREAVEAYNERQARWRDEDQIRRAQMRARLLAAPTEDDDERDDPFGSGGEEF